MRWPGGARPRTTAAGHGDRRAGARHARPRGDQTGGRVAFFLHTEDLGAELDRWLAAGARAQEEVREEAYGRVCVVRDPWGNRWDLVEPGPGQR